MKWLVRLGLLALLVVIAQRVHQHDDMLAATYDTLGAERREIRQTEAEVDDLDQGADALDARLRDLDRQITALEREHPNGIPQGEYDDYLRLVDERNGVAEERNALLAYRQRVVRDYREDVDRHNDETERANTLAQRGTPWQVARDFWDGLVESWTGD